MAVWGFERDEIMAIAADIGLRPRSSAHQCYLYDLEAVRRVVSSSGVRDGDRVLEVGPGIGTVTVGLLARGAHVTAVEVDPLLARRLPETVGNHTHSELHRLSVLSCDVMNLKASDLDAEPSLALLSVPPDVATASVLHVLAEFPSLRVVVAIGDALAHRWRAVARGEAGYDVAVARLRYLAALHAPGTLQRSAFWPRPRHDLDLIRLDVID